MYKRQVASLGKLGLKRVIFHRKNTFEDMKAVVAKCGKKDGTEDLYKRQEQ